MSLMTPFGSPAAPAGAPGATPIPEPAGSSRRTLLIVGAVLAVVAAAAGAYLLLFSGSSEDDAAQYALAPRPSSGKTAAAPAVTPSAVPTAITRVAPVKARNPFIPLVVAAGAPSDGTGLGGSPPASSVTAVPSSGSTPGVPVSPPVPVSPVAPVRPVVPVVPVDPVVVPVQPVAPATTTVRMGKVDADNAIAHMTVGSQSKLVLPGQTIGGFTLLNLRDGSCGAIQHGTTVFDLCEGSSRTLR